MQGKDSISIEEHSILFIKFMDKIDCETDCIGIGLNGLLFLHLFLQSVVNFQILLFLEKAKCFTKLLIFCSLCLFIYIFWRTYPYFKL